MNATSFISAAKDAFYLILRNPVRIGLVSGFGDIFEFLGTAAICLLTTFSGYMALTKTEYY
jgi:hypothetical protein